MNSNKIETVMLNLHNRKNWREPFQSTPTVMIPDTEIPNLKHLQTCLSHPFEDDGIEDGDKVYFSGFSKFPRFKFRETYKNNPIVKSADKADVIVFDMVMVRTTLNNQHTVGYYKLVDPPDTWGTNGMAGGKPSHFCYYIQGWKAKDISAISGGKKLVTDEYLLKNINKDCVELTEEMIENIANLMSSGNRDDIRMAVNICTTLDYTRYSHIIAYLLLCSGQQFNGWYGISLNSMGTLFAKKLEEDYRFKNKQLLPFLGEIMHKLESSDQAAWAEKLVQVFVDKNMGQGRFKITRI